mgnify:CR=1 FL=1
MIFRKVRNEQEELDHLANEHIEDKRHYVKGWMTNVRRTVERAYKRALEGNYESAVGILTFAEQLYSEFRVQVGQGVELRDFRRLPEEMKEQVDSYEEELARHRTRIEDIISRRELVA